MASRDFGTGVSRTLDAAKRQFTNVVFRIGSPPLDSEFNLQDDVCSDIASNHIKSSMPSGFFTDPTRAFNDYKFDPSWTNYFVLGNPRTPTGTLDSVEKTPVLWANINGWVIPVCGTQVAAEGELFNIVNLYPAPLTDTRTDLVFLEAWQCRIDSNPATANKPSADKIWTFGNVLYGGDFLDDDLEDPAIRYETTARIQVQYRIRVFGSGAGLGASVALGVYPDGLGDPNVLGQGTATLPIGGFIFSNMRRELGDPSLWRAGDGNPNNALGTVDGYVYAVPICAVFRRASQAYTAINSAGNPTQNGAFERTPGIKFLADPLAGNYALLTATLTFPLAYNDALPAVVAVTNLNGSGLEDTSHVLSSTFLRIDDEIIGISNVNIAGGEITIPVGGRGRNGTAAVGHLAGATISFFNTRPDGLFADQIAQKDILDLRQSVNANDWDFNRLLAHNVAALTKGELRTTWKQSDTGNTVGTVVHEVDYLYQGGGVPNYTQDIDGLDGIRQIWSDAAVPQFDVVTLLDNEATQDPQFLVGYTNDTFDDLVFWDTAPGLYPSGFMNVFGSAATDVWRNGSCLFFFTGGQTGSEGARASFKGNKQSVRALMPYEYWKSGYPIVDPTNGNQNPWTLRFLDQRGLEPSPDSNSFSDSLDAEHHIGPMYPWRDLNFEYPFIVLGGLLHSSLRFTSVPSANLSNPGLTHQIDLGTPDFDTAGIFYSLDTAGDFENDPTAITIPLMHDTRTLYGMLTDGGRDRTGVSSQVYVVLYGDIGSWANNGVFKVVGAGTVGYTTHNASNATSIVVEPINAAYRLNSGIYFDFDTITMHNLFVEFRSQEHNSEDLSAHSSVPPVPDLVVVLTDIGGDLATHPWYKVNLGGADAIVPIPASNYDLSMPRDALDDFPAIASKALVSMSLLYHPGRGGEARVPDDLVRFSRVGDRSIGAYLRQSPAVVDTTFPAFTGAPDNEAFYDSVHVQTWNRLPALGWHAPDAPNYGGNVIGYTEQDREHELFFDKGSKTLIFRPFRDRRMTLQAMSWTQGAGGLLWSYCLIGHYRYQTPWTPWDCLSIFTGTSLSGKIMGFPIPKEWMPRFGRQDIPSYQDVDAGAGSFLGGINHLFRDVADNTDPVFNIIGGYANGAGVPGVNSGFFCTSDMAGITADYGKSYIAPVPALTPYIGARRTTDINSMVPFASEVIAKLAAVTSTDLGRGLKGIQLPPCYGIARLYGVYDAVDYIAAAGLTFKADRITPEPNACPNLLRQDVDQQTLFILQDGAQDFMTPVGTATPWLGHHTYIIPENVLDLTRANNPGATFESHHYVVECAFFGFSRGWIDENNFVLVRHYSGTGVENIDGINAGGPTPSPFELEGVHMIIPCAAALNDQVYSAYNRTVYQGDVYQSRRGGAMTVSDYEVRYGQIDIANQYLLETPIQQFTTGGSFVPEIPNPKSFEVLASMDFYTTLGTGKIGGELIPGTMLDVGYTQDTTDAALRHPSSSTQTPWRIEPRTFTEGQKESSNRASLGVTLIGSTTNGPVDGLNPTIDEYSQIIFKLLDDTQVTLWASTVDNRAHLEAAPHNIAPEDIFDINEMNIPQERTAFYPIGAEPPVQPGKFAVANPIVINVPGAIITDSVIVNVFLMFPIAQATSIQACAYVSAADTVELRIFNQWSPMPFIDPTNAGSYVDSTASFTIPANTYTKHVTYDLGALTFNGASTTADQCYVVQSSVNTDGLLLRAAATAANTVHVWLTNTTDVDITIGFGGRDTVVAMLNPMDLAAHTYDISASSILLRVISTGYFRDLSKTALSLVNCININTKLQRTVVAKIPAQDSRILLEAIPTGLQGNNIQVRINQMHIHAGVPTYNVYTYIQLEAPYTNSRSVGAHITSSPLMGGVDFPFNGGNGTSPLKLTGMTERLPLGALLQDSDFLCENPLNDTASAMRALPGGPRPIQTLMPLTGSGDEYSRFFGEPGELLTLADGSPAMGDYVPYTTTTPAGTRKFRLYRGGGSAFVASGDNPGGPLDWVTEVFPKTLQPALKGGILGCRAMLVRNFYEEVSAGPHRVSDGDEIQMVVLTYGMLGSGNTQNDGITLNNIISPSGYGEGYAAADRYKIAGRPMFRGWSREIPDPTDVTLTVYPITQR